NTGFDLHPGSYSLKFLMRDNRTGKLGTFEQALQVPEAPAKSLQTSSIVLGSRLVDAKASGAGVEHRGFGGPRGFGGRGPRRAGGVRRWTGLWRRTRLRWWSSGALRRRPRARPARLQRQAARALDRQCLPARADPLRLLQGLRRVRGSADAQAANRDAAP